METTKFDVPATIGDALRMTTRTSSVMVVDGDRFAVRVRVDGYRSGTGRLSVAVSGDVRRYGGDWEPVGTFAVPDRPTRGELTEDVIRESVRFNRTGTATATRQRLSLVDAIDDAVERHLDRAWRGDADVVERFERG